MTRDKFTTKTILLNGQVSYQRALALMQTAPIDLKRPLEFVLREQVKSRKPDQNALMWAGPLKDIAEQVVSNGRRYSAEVWHEYFKRQYLPEFFDAVQCKETYRKWEEAPDGTRTLIGSTTQLTVKGFAQYMEQVYAFGANHGVRFQANPHDARWAA